jgi:hypothetical protein
MRDISLFPLYAPPGLLCLLACITESECVIITADKHTSENLYPEREVQMSCVNETALIR